MSSENDPIFRWIEDRACAYVVSKMTKIFERNDIPKWLGYEVIFASVVFLIENLDPEINFQFPIHYQDFYQCWRGISDLLLKHKPKGFLSLFEGIFENTFGSRKSMFCSLERTLAVLDKPKTSMTDPKYWKQDLGLIIIHYLFEVTIPVKSKFDVRYNVRYADIPHAAFLAEKYFETLGVTFFFYRGKILPIFFQTEGIPSWRDKPLVSISEFNLPFDPFLKSTNQETVNYFAWLFIHKLQEKGLFEGEPDVDWELIWNSFQNPGSDTNYDSDSDFDDHYDLDDPEAERRYLEKCDEEMLRSMGLS